MAPEGPLELPTADPRWPNFFLIGAAKAGTTSLHRYLDQHPNITMSTKKEAHFYGETWDAHRHDAEALQRQAETYLALFDGHEDAAIRGESTPGYLWWPNVPQRIQDTVSNPRFAVSLRDPIERAYSDHLMHVRQGLTDRSFLDRIQDELDERDNQAQGLITPGLYHRHLERYVERFGQDRVHALLFDDLKQDPLSVLKNLAGFLEVDPDAMHHVDYGTVHNPYGEPLNAAARWLKQHPLPITLARLLLPERLRIYLGEHVLVKKREKPPMDPDARTLLIDVFTPEINRLETLLNQDFSPLWADWETTPNPAED